MAVGHGVSGVPGQIAPAVIRVAGSQPSGAEDGDAGEVGQRRTTPPGDAVGVGPETARGRVVIVTRYLEARVGSARLGR